MKALPLVVPALLGLALAPPLAAQTLAQQLAGKTCQGTFASGKHRAGSEGALQLRFAAAGGGLSAQAWRVVGKQAFDQAAYALTQGRPVDASGWQSLGQVGDLTIAGDKLRYVDPLGARVALTLKDADLSGQSDPRGGRDPTMTRLQFVNLRCR